MLDPAVVRAITAHLSLTDKAFLVGGQALNFWAEYYSRAPELVEYAPYTSKDIDYFGRRKAAQKLADALGGRAIFPDPDYQTPQTAIVKATFAGHDLVIDFLDFVIGVKSDSLERQAVEIVVPIRAGEEQGELRIPVMHPLHCLQSRAANVMTLRRTDDATMRQLGAAPIILREYVADLLADGDVQEAQATLQALFQYLRSDTHGREVHQHSRRDPLLVIEAFADDERFPELYRQHNIRSMLNELARRRGKDPTALASPTISPDEGEIGLDILQALHGRGGGRGD